VSASPGDGQRPDRSRETRAFGAGRSGDASEASVPRTGPRFDQPQNIATAIADVSERVAVLVREEVELAKAEVSEKVSRLARGAVVAAVAGVFLLTALFFVLIGLAWLLYYYLPIGSTFTYFVGFFAMALILVVLGVLAGVVAAKAVKRGGPPVPTMALEEARLIRETMGASADGAPRANPVAASGGASPVSGGVHGASGGDEEG
jgi:uncharacterized membrane protein YgcG